MTIDEVGPAKHVPRRGRPRKRPAESGDTREDIVLAASELFSARGIDVVTMAEIAARAGLEQSSLYYWFRSKADILANILDRANRAPLEIVERQRTAPGPVTARLRQLVREDVVALSDFPFDINEVHRLALRDPDAFGTYWAQRARLINGVESLILEGIENGELRCSLDASLAALTLLANDEATQNWARQGPDSDRFTVELVADHLAEQAVRTLSA